MDDPEEFAREIVGTTRASIAKLIRDRRGAAAHPKRDPWHDWYRVIAWALHDMPANRRAAFLSVRENGLQYADLARERGVADEAVRKDFIDAVTDILGALGRNRRARSGLGDDAIPPHPDELDASRHPDVVLLADYLARALSREEEADVERRLTGESGFFERVASLVQLWLHGMDYRDLVARLARDRPARFRGNRTPTFGEAAARILSSIARAGEPPLAGSGEEGPSVEDCFELFMIALSGDARMSLERLTIMSSTECMGNERAGRRWTESIKRLRAAGRITREESYFRIDGVCTAVVAGAYLLAHDPEIIEIEKRNQAMYEAHGIEEGRDFTGHPEPPAAWLANMRELRERNGKLDREFLRSVGEDEMIAWLEARGDL